MDKLSELRDFVANYSAAPDLAHMPRRTLSDKGINGPTGAHIIEEIHTPFNFSYVTATTGSTAFQNLVGVTAPELPRRIAAGRQALELAAIPEQADMLVTYPPLVNVFSKEALTAHRINWDFLSVSSRDALILALCDMQPTVVLGESSFLRAALADMEKLELTHLLPHQLIFLCAGTPLDMELLPLAERLCGGKVHDLYGCQEFGWLALDGIPLREDITLAPVEMDFFHLLVGGLPTGDCFPVSDAGHICNPSGKIITYSRGRGGDDWEVRVMASTASSRDTVARLAKTILRIKARIVRVDEQLILGAEQTVLSVGAFNADNSNQIEGVKTGLFDELLTAQMAYQRKSKTDPAWIKGR